MKKALLMAIMLGTLTAATTGCHRERVYFHNKNGKVKHVRARILPPWFFYRESGYSKHTRRMMRHWDREQGW